MGTGRRAAPDRDGGEGGWLLLPLGAGEIGRDCGSKASVVATQKEKKAGELKHPHLTIKQQVCVCHSTPFSASHHRYLYVCVCVCMYLGSGLLWVWSVWPF